MRRMVTEPEVQFALINNSLQQSAGVRLYGDLARFADVERSRRRLCRNPRRAPGEVSAGLKAQRARGPIDDGHGLASGARSARCSRKEQPDGVHDRRYAGACGDGQYHPDQLGRICRIRRIDAQIGEIVTRWQARCGYVNIHQRGRVAGHAAGG